MSGAIEEQAIAHLTRRAHQRRSRHTLPEIDLGEGPLEFWVAPLSIGDVSKWGARLEKEEPEAIVDMFIAKAQDRAGNALFTDKIKPALLTLEVSALQSLAACLTVGGDNVGTLEGARGKS